MIKFKQTKDAIRKNGIPIVNEEGAVIFRLQSKKRFTISIAIMLFVLLFPAMQFVDAHPYSASYTTLNLTKSYTKMIYTLDELSVIELTNGDLNHNGMLEQEEFDAVKDRLIEIIKENIMLKINGEEKSWISIESIILDRKGNDSKLILSVIYSPVSESQSISLKDHLYLGDTKTNYANLLTIHYGSQTSTAAISGNHRTWAMQLTEEDYAGLKQDDLAQPKMETNELEKTAQDMENSTSGWLSFFKLGMNHILEGFDHLLFLFSLLIARQTFKQYAAVITSFTIAHSLTLTLTVLGWIDLSPKIVEPLIALSICYVAIDNLIRKEVSHRWILTFVFGLVHGMGFADILKEMDIPKSELAVDLVSFNIGIETVQLAIVIVLLPLVGLLHRWKYSRRAVFIGSIMTLVLGAIWLVERVLYA
ncbi:HupE/UreJ family protein [Bacillus sp. FJAT-29790]|uniref:HupE/UreJ family protein n=1 Tax=Bacillus sp. FJAT-29790 TaxID=1895002 RepID=UPI001C24141E|nr:HupE/UreJ family protein [Bacillus sp. FJAT-29790]MBU8880966.1 HupE/UreJ family protein [Bacillus sp. FJAT-29790]